jgi:hypothetical protein
LSVSEYEFIVITTLLLSFHIIAPCHGKIVGSIAMIIPGFDTWPHVCFVDGDVQVHSPALNRLMLSPSLQR